MNYDKIKITASKNKITLKSLAEQTDLTEHGFHAAIKNNSLKVRDLEKIAAILGVRTELFFIDDNSIDSNGQLLNYDKSSQQILNQKETEIKYLNTQITDLREQIKLLNEMIELLKK